MKKTLLLFGLFLLLLSSCRNKEAQLVKFDGKALGTFYTVSYYDIEGRNMKGSLDSLFDVFNHVLSVYDSTSLISMLNRNALFTPHEWFTEVFNVSKEIYDATSGAFDPSVGPLVNAWGFGFTDAESMTQEKVDSLLGFVGFNRLQITDGFVVKEDPRITLDFNAIAKGYCSDIAALYLESMGIDTYLIEIGGEIASKGHKPDGSPWKVGIERPSDNATDAQQVMQVIHISGKSLATSGNYRRYYEKDGKRYSHTIDPSTGYPAENDLMSVTVIADRCIVADAYATAFMVMGTEKAMAFASERRDIEAYFISTDAKGDLKISFTEGFGAYLE